MLFYRKFSNNFTFSTLLRQIYQQTITKNGMNLDNKQLDVIDSLQKLNDRLINTHPKWKIHSRTLSLKQSEAIRNVKQPIKPNQSQKLKQKKNFFSIFSKQFSTYSSNSLRIHGLYLYGGSGCGKSFLSDMFYDQLVIQQKKRMHFHQFMASIHSQLFQLQRQKKGYDPLVTVARNTAQKIRLLYLDQFQVTDVADASILKRLFQQLISNQLVLLATSNRHPTQLYKNGHQRQFFLPFIDLIQKQCQIHHLDSNKDYRYELQVDKNDLKTSYIYPINQTTHKKLKRVIQLLVNKKNVQLNPVTLITQFGRQLKVPNAYQDVCYYQFHQLVQKFLGDSDFRCICQNFKAIVIKGMRQIKRNQRDIANRMIKLFDQAYFRHVKLYISGQTDLENIIQALPENQCRNQQDFAMTRCKSRLMEFQTKKYKEQLSEIQIKKSQNQGKNQPQKK